MGGLVAYEEQENGGSLSAGRRIGRIERTVDGHGTRLDSLENWRAEMRGAAMALKVLASLSGVNLLALVVLLLQGQKPT